MSSVNEKGYIERKIQGIGSRVKIKTKHGQKLRDIARRRDYRDWWLCTDKIHLGEVWVPMKYHGKRIRFKIEVLEHNGKKT